ncbi:hypothetical protein COLO4_35023 [Corchorus olitorius]|uniref:Uncharacterized protein n=1 Tax=Corchorus olitorius TaxID=93759 RepID=A0A1R3GIC9_9ROSI|nr:hypothetical protein COLO4_35023 [Corchorus olitorius]
MSLLDRPLTPSSASANRPRFAPSMWDVELQMNRSKSN